MKYKVRRPIGIFYGCLVVGILRNVRRGRRAIVGWK